MDNKLYNKEDGQTVAEYGLLTLLIAVLIIVSSILLSIGQSISALFSNIINALSSL